MPYPLVCFVVDATDAPLESLELTLLSVGAASGRAAVAAIFRREGAPLLALTAPTGDDTFDSLWQSLPCFVVHYDRPADPARMLLLASTRCDDARDPVGVFVPIAAGETLCPGAVGHILERFAEGPAVGLVFGDLLGPGGERAFEEPWSARRAGVGRPPFAVSRAALDRVADADSLAEVWRLVTDRFVACHVPEPLFREAPAPAPESRTP